MSRQLALSATASVLAMALLALSTGLGTGGTGGAAVQQAAAGMAVPAASATLP